MPVTLEQGEAQSVIDLEGAIDIACATELKKVLLQALESGRAVRVAVEHATDLDVTAVQLLWAAGREAKGLGLEFTLAGTMPEEISATLADAGLEKFSITENGE
jgi:anti-anti-sigma regulatory factor